MNGTPSAAGVRWLPYRLVPSLPGLAAVALFLVLARLSGGYFPHTWYAGTLFVAALLIVSIVARPDLTARIPPLTGVALLAFAAFTLWGYVGITWADVRGDAWDGANRTALYLLVFTLFALWRWNVPSAVVVLAAFSLGVTLLGLVSLVEAGTAADVGAYFNDARLTHPIGYANGNAALFLLAFWPALFLASRRELPLLARPPLLAAAAVLLQLAVLPQSRGGYVAFAASLALAFLLLPSRLRLLVALVPVLAVTALAAPSLGDVSAAQSPNELSERIRAAGGAIAAGGAAVLLAGLALAVADRRVRVSEGATRWAGRAILAAAVLALVAGLPVAVGDPRARAADAWDEFATPQTQFDGRVGLARGLETNRADLWRVALVEFREQPLRGIGPDNFGVAYLQQRRSLEETLYPHSFPLQVLSQTGVTGAALMLALLLTAGIAAIRCRIELRGLGAGVSGVALVLFGYWLAHAAVDWLWELPALTAPALAALALAGNPARRTEDPAWRRGWGTILAAVVLAGALAIAVSSVFPWLAAREMRYAAAAWRADPTGAAEALERARRLNPLTERADLAAGSIARRRGEWGRMAAAYERALERNPYSWYAHLQLSLARAQQGDAAGARRSLADALRLNPNEPLLEMVAGWLERGEPVDVAEVTRIFDERYRERTR